MDTVKMFLYFNIVKTFKKDKKYPLISYSCKMENLFLFFSKAEYRDDIKKAPIRVTDVIEEINSPQKVAYIKFLQYSKYAF